MASTLRIVPPDARSLTKQDIAAIRECTTIMFHLVELSSAPGEPDYSSVRKARVCQLTLLKEIKESKSGWRNEYRRSHITQRLEYLLPVSCSVGAYGSSRGDYDDGSYETLPALNVTGAYFSADYLSRRDDWAMFKTLVRAGDTLEVHIVADNNNRYSSQNDLHVDECYLVVQRQAPRTGRVKRYSWLMEKRYSWPMEYGVCEQNSARRVDGNYPHGWVNRSSSAA